MNFLLGAALLAIIGIGVVLFVCFDTTQKALDDEQMT
jgi:hypothetical protein